MSNPGSRWRRIEVPRDLHERLEREAKEVHLSTQAYAAYLLSRGMDRDRALAEVPMRDRGRHEERGEDPFGNPLLQGSHP